LLRDKHLTIGRYDGRLTSESPLNTGETAESDPSSSLITPPFTAVLTNYLRNELGFKTDMYYYPSGGRSPGITASRTASATRLRNCAMR